jgi:hypothetical protein
MQCKMDDSEKVQSTSVLKGLQSTDKIMHAPQPERTCKCVSVLRQRKSGQIGKRVGG